MFRFSIIIFCILIAQSVCAQKLYRGIVVDSASMNNLPGVHVTIKNAAKGTSTDLNGVFVLYANPTDTLLISSVGHLTAEIPLLFQEETLFILLRENKILLNEIVIKSTRLYPNKIEDRTRVKPKTMSGVQGIVSPFDYFWKLEREKRKLSRVIEENNKTQTYVQVITDPDVREILKKEYELTDEAYNNLLVEFNRLHRSVHYYTDEDGIMEELHRFFEFHTRKK